MSGKRYRPPSKAVKREVPLTAADERIIRRGDKEYRDLHPERKKVEPKVRLRDNG